MQNLDIKDELLITYLMGEASPEDIQRVESWRNADPACNKRYEEFKVLWDASKKLSDTEVTDTEAAFYRYKKKSSERVHAQIRSIRNRKVRRWIGIAASVMLMTGGMWFYFAPLTTNTIQLITRTETRTDSLPDGSVITLNRFSRFEYPSKFSGGVRRVTLDTGEAFFSVAHSKAKPFLIIAGPALIRVVGTSFNVKYKKGSVEVIVETGIVQVSNKHQLVLLHPGDKLTIKQGSENLKKQRNPDQLYTWYRQRKFIADDTPLWRMIEVLNEAYDSHIVIGRKELYNLPLNTSFEDVSLDKVLDVISRTFKLTVEKKNGQIILK